jgi:hypothetical protein
LTNGTVNVSGLASGASWQYSTDAGDSWLTGTDTFFGLSSGSYGAGSILVRQVDLAGNTSDTAQLGTVTIDTSAPAVDSVVATGSYITGGDGNLNAGKTVTISVNTSEPVTISGGTPSLSLNSGGSATYISGSGTTSLVFSYTVAAGHSSSDLAITALNANGALLGDAAGNSFASFSNNPAGVLVIDTNGPAAPSLALASDSGVSTSDGITNNGTVNVTGLEDGASWQYSTNGGSSWLAGTGTSFSVTPGTYASGRIRVRQSDIAGNTSGTAQLGSITVDTSAPTATAAISAVNDNVGLIRGNLAADAVSDDTTPTISGSISAALATGNTLRIYNGDAFLGIASVNNTAKTWFYTPTLPSTSGTSYSISARVADTAGNLGTASTSFSFSLDTSAPTTTSAITAVNDNVGLIQGDLAADAVSDDDTPTISGTISAALASGETLRISNGATFLGLATVDNATLTWSYSPTLPSAAGTSYAISARVADATGNLGTASASFSFSINTRAPAVTVAITAVNDNVGLIRGNLAADADSDDTTPTISGTISAAIAIASGDSLRIYNGDTFLGTASVNNTTKTWSYKPTFPSSSGTSYSISARVADAAGNLGTASDSFSFNLDTSTPTTTAAITAVDDNVGLIRGDLAASAVSDDDTPTISGTISAPLASGDSLRISNGATFLGLATVDNATLSWSYSPTLPSTSGTSYAISARVADAAGNLGTASTRFFFSLDTSAPAVNAAITTVKDNVGLIRGNLAADAVSDDATPTISGTISAGLATGETLRIYNGDSFLGIASVNNTAKTWSFTPSTPLGNGFYAVSARVSDVAGNLGAASQVQRFSIDSTSNQLIGNATGNRLTATNAKDLITGLGGADTFRFTSLTQSTLANFDRISDFTIGTDILDGPNAITAVEINKLGLADSLDASSISTLLTSSTFLANKAATFSYDDPFGVSRSFIALNDGFAGYSASNDAIIEITGYTGLLASLLVS